MSALLANRAVRRKTAAYVGLLVLSLVIGLAPRPLLDVIEPAVLDVSVEDIAVSVTAVSEFTFSSFLQLTASMVMQSSATSVSTRDFFMFRTFSFVHRPCGLQLSFLSREPFCRVGTWGVPTVRAVKHARGGI